MKPQITISSDSFPAIRGYTITEQLYSGSRTAVYRAIQTNQQLPVVIKVLQREYPSFEELVQFRNQYAIAKNLPIPGIVQPVSLERLGNSYALVMEDWGGLSLSQYDQERSLDLAGVLNVALQLATILHSLHQQRVIHKDIKPANVLIHPESKQVKLIDFSIASLLPKETQEIQNPNILEGTLAYLAPEQTGRMNRGIDYRADFYALGVTLYQLLSGQLPFESDDPLELLHCHIAKVPVPVEQVNPAVPSMVGAIAAKLMAKNAEDRYQSALGLQHDLQECLSQWQKTGEISEFELGERDLSDRFIIPEKLYGREQEVQTLLKAFERVSQSASELMLVSGFSGIGKTAVVNEVHKPITQQKGYFIKGKFDQFNRNIPLSAFVQALQDLIGQLLCESDAQLAQWQAQILEAVGKNGQVLIEVIPELEQVIGQQPAAPELSGSAVQNRFNLLFQKFIQVFTTAAHPLVIFLDDLQWADAASLQLLKVLMDDNGYLLVLGAYRDNEVSPAHPLMLTISDLKKANFTVNTITLTSLSLEHTNHLIADTLRCSRERAQSLTQLVDRKTQGNPFFTTQFLKALHEEGYITFERNQGYWQCDMAQVNALVLTDDVVEFMALQLQKLPGETQQVLKLAACIGNQFDLATLAIVAEQSLTEAATALWNSLQEGLIVPITQIYKFFHAEEIESSDVQHSSAPVYRFLHDRIQQAAYSLIPEDQKQWTHYHIGQLLLKQTSPTAREEQVFELVNQLNHGISLITQPSEQFELAQLNLIAAQKARAAAAYEAAQNHVALGLSLLGEEAWEEHYKIVLVLYELAAEIAFLMGDFAQMEAWIHTVITQAHTLLDKTNVYQIQIQSIVSQAKFAEALIIAQEILQELGITFVATPTSADIQKEIQEITELIDDREIIDLLHLPENVDKLKLAIIQMTTGVAPAAYLSGSPLFPLLISCAVKLSIQSGNTADSALAYSLYSIVTCNFLQDVDTATAFSQLALQLVAKLDAKAVKPEIYSAVGLYILHRKSPVTATLPLFFEGYTAALEVGNLEYVAFNANEFCTYSFWCGQPLTTLEQESRDYSLALINLNQLAVANYCCLCWQSTLNLLGRSDNPTLLAGEALQETELLPFMLAAHDLAGLYFFYLYKLMLCYLFGNIDLANHDALEIRNYLMAGAGTLGEAVFYFYDSLIALAQLPSVTEEQASTLEQRVERNQTQLQFWAHHAPMNHQHKVDLVSAERYRVLGQSYEAGDYYDRAIAKAKENGYIQEEALANELAAQFYLDWGKEKVAAGYLQEAYYSYAQWGAKAKVDDLEKRYPQLLQPILQGANQPLTVLETLTSIATSSVYSIHATASKSESSGINQTLDFAALLQISQTFASTIALDELLQTLTQTMLENSGADRCALMLCEDNQWQVRVMANLKQMTLQSVPLENNPRVPVKLIQYVKNTVTTVVIDALKTDLPVIGDYLHHHQPKSVLCLPILNQGNLRAILYLENRSASGVFTGDRILILNFLCTQAAISLENASLYQKVSHYSHTLEAEVLRQTQVLHQKNQELEQILKNLQQTQAQLIQTEKMSSLGQLVAGIAHEINNPVNFIKGNITPLANYVEDLKDLLALYQENSSQTCESLQIKQEEIDLDFLFQDVESILKSMTTGSDRIHQIVLSLRNFSRLDESSTKAVDLHSGIDSTLLILQHRFQKIGDFPEIRVICDYGDLPRITCFPSQLNQVFLHIINNAIDAIRENFEGSDNPEIRIRTETLDQERIRIAIANTDSQIPSEIQDRIFDPFFTTKPVGSGTGLGLFVSYSIIQKHGGTLRVRSPSSGGAEFEMIIPLG